MHFCKCRSFSRPHPTRENRGLFISENHTGRALEPNSKRWPRARRETLTCPHGEQTLQSWRWVRTADQPLPASPLGSPSGDRVLGRSFTPTRLPPVGRQAGVGPACGPAEPALSRPWEPHLVWSGHRPFQESRWGASCSLSG